MTPRSYRKLIRHRNGDPTDNDLDNLEVVTMFDKRATGKITTAAAAATASAATEATTTTTTAPVNPPAQTWPVRIGGEYPQSGGDDNWRRVVTAITEQGQVCYSLRFRRPGLGWSEPAGHHYVDLAMFRAMSASEDQSALPAVEAWLAGLVDNGIGSTVVELGDVLRQADALLAEIRAGKAGEVAGL